MGLGGLITTPMLNYERVLRLRSFTSPLLTLQDEERNSEGADGNCRGHLFICQFLFWNETKSRKSKLEEEVRGASVKKMTD